VLGSKGKAVRFTAFHAHFNSRSLTFELFVVFAVRSFAGSYPGSLILDAAVDARYEESVAGGIAGIFAYGDGEGMAGSIEGFAFLPRNYSAAVSLRPQAVAAPRSGECLSRRRFSIDADADCGTAE
jgi:hypothetical protein